MEARPEATVTLAGTFSAALLVDSATVEPAGPVTLDSVTKHLEESPEERAVGAQANEVTTGGTTAHTPVSTALMTIWTSTISHCSSAFTSPVVHGVKPNA